MSTPIEARPQKPQSMLAKTIIVSVALHLIAGVGAGIWIVAKYFAPPEAVFVAKKSVTIPPRQLEEKMAAAEMEAMSPKPTFDDKMASTRPTDFALPDVPNMPVEDMMPIDPSSILSDNITGLVGAGGMGGGGGEGAGGFGGTGSGMSFFGIKDNGKSVVIMIDVSDSMFTRTGDVSDRTLVRQGKEQAFQHVRDQAIQLVQGLSINTRFGIVRWSGGAHSWKAELVPATDQNKEAAISHIQTTVDFKKAPPRDGRPGGTRHDYALEEAFRLQPEVIFMLTDGNATAAQEGGGLSPIPAEDILAVAETGQSGLVEPARVHVIYYVTGGEKSDERDMLEKLAKKNKGDFKKIEAEKPDESKKTKDSKKERDEAKARDNRN